MLGVIFDMDGVLVDSYGPHFESWQGMAAERGLSVTEEQFRATFGRTSRESMATFWGPGRYRDEEIRLMDHRKEELFREILARKIPIMPGARELLAALREAGFRLAVGSSAPPENLKAVLKHFDDDAFDAVVSGADVQRGKPDPQVFMTAAARLRIPPEWCVVIEDAPAGIQAAKAAGAACIGLASTGRTRDSLAEADLVVDQLAELSPARITEIIESNIRSCGE